MFFGFGGWLYDFNCDGAVHSGEWLPLRAATVLTGLGRLSRPPLWALPVPEELFSWFLCFMWISVCFPFLECDSFLLSIAFVKFILFVFIVTHSGLWSESWSVLRGPLHGSDSPNYCGHDAKTTDCCPSHSLKLHCGLNTSQFRSVQ